MKDPSASVLTPNSTASARGLRTHSPVIPQKNRDVGPVRLQPPNAKYLSPRDLLTTAAANPPGDGLSRYFNQPHKT
uniref:Uncharacterized protein n=1 Tax=Knipowitschia caucasica TaxID=637954 RepID=A0AAV2K422_KNICA